ncbi:hypothetical protein EDB83DRAFT_1857958 [Lactarius deliciosus]|nr:hypothetical protein EDB83DRAFT_1857958 [Lactarius deliciosus]
MASPPMVRRSAAHACAHVHHGWLSVRAPMSGETYLYGFLSRHLGRRRFSSRLRSHLFQLLSALLWRTGLSRTLTNFGQSSGLRPGLSSLSLSLLANINTSCIYTFQPQSILVLSLRASELCRTQFPSFSASSSVPRHRVPLATSEGRASLIKANPYAVTRRAEACTTSSTASHLPESKAAQVVLSTVDPG